MCVCEIMWDLNVDGLGGLADSCGDADLVNGPAQHWFQILLHKW